MSERSSERYQPKLSRAVALGATALTLYGATAVSHENSQVDTALSKAPIEKAHNTVVQDAAHKAATGNDIMSAVESVGMLGAGMATVVETSAVIGAAVDERRRQHQRQAARSQHAAEGH